MARHFPEPQVENIGRHHLLESSERVLVLDEIDQRVVDMRSFFREEPTARRVRVMVPKLLLLTYLSVVSLFGLFEEF